jgi:hypothetical protein
MKTKKHGVALLACTLLILAGCTKTVNTSIPVEKLTQDDYFALRESNEKGKYGPVVIFPERHNSRLIQAEFGWALNMLLEDCGINTIALEGMYQGEAMSGVSLPNDTEEEKYTALLAILERGDIKAPEFMYLAKNSFVFGTEKKSEYAIGISDDDRRAYIHYLIMSIIVDQGSQKSEALNSLLKKSNSNLDAILSMNPWTYETYNIISKGRSLKETNKRIKELEKKLKPVDSVLNAQTKTNFGNFKKYEEIVYRRSHTMSRNVLRKLRKNNEALAMIIGAAHTEDVTRYFDKKRVRYYVLEPSGLDAVNIWSDLTTAEYKRKNDGKSVFTNTQIGNFFENSHNSRPTYDKSWVRKQMDFTSLIRSMIARSSSPSQAGGPPPDIFNSNGLRIIQGSIDVSRPGDIRFCVENDKGERLYVRAVKNIENYRFESVQKAFQDMIERLSKINEQNITLDLKMESIASVIEVINVGAYAVYFSAMKDTLWQESVSTF